MIFIEKIREICNKGNIVVTNHAQDRMDERGISLPDIKTCISGGVIIEQYENDTPLPSCLVMGPDNSNLIIHVVVSANELTLYVITAYRPTEDKWLNDLRTRRE